MGATPRYLQKDEIMRPYAAHCRKVVLLSWLLAGCGLSVPQVQEIWDSDIAGVPGANGAPKLTGSAQIEFEIQKRVYCELKDAVRSAQIYNVEESDTINGKETTPQNGLIPSEWGALIALSLQVDESSSLTPGVTLNTVLPNNTKVFGPGSSGTVTTPQSRNVGFGATLSSTATRIDKWNPSYSIKFLNEAPRAGNVCQKDPLVETLSLIRPGLTPARSSPLIIESDLGIRDWLLGAMFVNDMLPSEGVTSGSGGTSDSSGTTKGQSISYDVKFIIVSSGSVTPTWKLVRITANTSGTLFSTGRTRTHELIITIGPTSGKAGDQTSNTHLASQIGQAVSGGNAAIFMMPSLQLIP
jgi:hypothetical protein